ncbi:hypothetical protein D3C80_1631430 [compost metagenome]
MRNGIEGRVGQPPGLLAHRLDDARVAVAEVEHADAADEVDVALALGIPDLGVAAVAEADRVDDGQGLADVGRLHGALLREGVWVRFMKSTRVAPRQTK